MRRASRSRASSAPRPAAPWPPRRRPASRRARRSEKRAPGWGVAAGEWRAPRQCAESSPQRQASATQPNARLAPGRGVAQGVRAHQPQRHPCHLAAARALASGVPAQLGEAAARICGRGELREVARRAHVRARSGCLRHLAGVQTKPRAAAAGSRSFVWRGGTTERISFPARCSQKKLTPVSGALADRATRAACPTRVKVATIAVSS